MRVQALQILSRKTVGTLLCECKEELITGNSITGNLSFALPSVYFYFPAEWAFLTVLHVLGYKAIFTSFKYSFHLGCMQAG